MARAEGFEPPTCGLEECPRLKKIPNKIKVLDCKTRFQKQESIYYEKTEHTMRKFYIKFLAAGRPTPQVAFGWSEDCDRSRTPYVQSDRRRPFRHSAPFAVQIVAGVSARCDCHQGCLHPSLLEAAAHRLRLQSQDRWGYCLGSLEKLSSPDA